MPSKCKAQGSVPNPVRRTTNWHCLRTIPLLLAAGSSPLRPRHALSDDVFVFLALGHTRKPVLSTCLTEKPLDHVKSARLWSSRGIHVYVTMPQRTLHTTRLGRLPLLATPHGQVSHHCQGRIGWLVLVSLGSTHKSLVPLAGFTLPFSVIKFDEF